MRPFPRSRPTRRTAVCAALALLAAVAIQIQQPAQADAAPFEVLPADPVATFSEFKNLPADSTQQVTITGNPNFTKALEVTVPNGPQSPGLDGEYEITLGVPAAATVTAGDALVATLWARAIEPTLTSEAVSISKWHNRDDVGPRPQRPVIRLTGPHRMRRSNSLLTDGNARDRAPRRDRGSRPFGSRSLPLACRS